MKAFLKRNLWILFLLYAIVLAGLCYLYYPVYVKRDMNLVDVPVAAITIDEQTLIEETMITTIPVTQDFLSSGIITNKEEIIGKYVGNKNTIPASGFFYTSQLTDEKTLYGTVEKKLEEDEVAYTFELSKEDGMNGTFKTNQKINVYGLIEYENEKGQRVYAMGEIVHGAKILALHQDNNGVANYMTIGIKEEDHAYLLLAKKLGSIDFTLPKQSESLTYGSTEYYDIASMKEFIDSYSSIKRKINEPSEFDNLTPEEQAEKFNSMVEVGN